MTETKYEIVKFVDDEFELEVNISPTEETVWLTQNQIAILFNTTKQNVSLHINNCFKDGELDRISVVKDFFTTASDGKVYKTKYFNLDVIISVGYRVKSPRGVTFRKWANKVLKQYLLKGYAIDSSRVLVTQENYLNLVNVVTEIKSSQLSLENRVEKLEDKLPKITQKLFFKGQMWDATSLIEDIIMKAKEEIILIDNYVDKKTLDLLSKKNGNVAVKIYTSEKGNKITEKEQKDFNAQYGLLTVKITDEFHDRFIILDKKILYHVGSSIKDAGKKAFEISEIEDEKQLSGIINRL